MATQYASRYSLDLYCDQPLPYGVKHWRSEMYTGETWTECSAAARKRGWKIHQETRTATCPLCVKRLKAEKNK